jgi:hypothetical protein
MEIADFIASVVALFAKSSLIPFPQREKRTPGVKESGPHPLRGNQVCWRADS